MTDYFTPISFARWHSDKTAFAEALGRSFRETGFAVISDHPIDQTVIDRAIAAAKSFFALPSDVKEKYHDAPGGRQRGYTPLGTENAKGAAAADLKEFWHTGRALPANSPYLATMKATPMVAEVDLFDQATQDFYQAMDEFGAQLLRAVALHLELSETWFDNKVQFGNSILRLLHYPPQKNPPPEGTVRAGAHEDINVITLLLGAEEAGLQALHRSGEWLDVNPPAGSLVINCGDMLQRLTGGILPSTTHRVLNPSPERAKFPRYSTPFFLHFNQDVMINALDSCLAEGGTAEPPITAQDYLLERLREIGLIKA
ncbi:MAG: 2-oxoglutarate and iron-dependent oxygenase domain-containing protein [Pseudomonadota bacterium]